MMGEVQYSKVGIVIDLDIWYMPQVMVRLSENAMLHSLVPISPVVVT